MKTSYAASLALLLSTGLAGTAPTEAAPFPATVTTPDDGRARLTEFVGLWTVRQALWMDAGKPPQIDTGTALFTTVLEGRQLQQDLRVGSRVPFQAIGYIGYDPRTNLYSSTWMDLNLSNVLVMRGRYDASDATYRLSGETTFDDGQVVPTREELHRLDETHFVVRYFETRRGREVLMVELAYSR